MPTANQKRMIKHINATVFKLLNDYHFDEITIQKFVITQKLIVVHFIVISKINTIFYSLYLTISQLNFIMKILDLFYRRIFQQFIYFIGEHKKVFKHLLTSSRQADVFRNLTHVSR